MIKKNRVLISDKISQKALETLQEKLFNNQIKFNKSMEGSLIEVLAENKLDQQDKFFGRNKFLSSVIFDGYNENIGKVVKIRIENSNQNTLFGKVEKNMKAA